MDLQELYKLFIRSNGISTDTRSIKEGQLFFALSGDTFDGDKFAKSAIEKGAVAAIVKFAPDEEGHYIETEDPLHTLQVLALYHRTQIPIPFIAITGSNGKTTTKELLNEALSTQYNVACTKGNLNNHIGVPLTLLEINQEHNIAIVEMGANHQGEIEFLCNITQPTHGVITNIGRAHLEGFGGPEGVLKAKSELYRHLEQNDGHSFVDVSQPKLKQAAPKEKRTNYGTAECSIFATLKQEYPLEFNLHLDKSEIDIALSIPGQYNMKNAVTAATIASYFDITPENIKSALEGYISSNNRSQSVVWKNNQVLLDAYNANPSSVEEALKLFSGIKHPKKIVVLGEMKELGPGADEEHRLIVEQANTYGFDQVILVGERFSPYQSQVGAYFQNVEELIQSEVLDVSNAYILVKGSRAIKLEKIIES